MRIKQSIERTLTQARIEVPRPNGLLHKLRYCFLFLAFYPVAFLSWSHRILNIISQEICSLFGRIEVQYKELDYIPVTRSYLSCSPTQRPFLNSYNHARSACISEMAANHPWATRVDLQLFLEGWDKGEKWASQTYSQDSCTAQSAANSLVDS